MENFDFSALLKQFIEAIQQVIAYIKNLVSTIRDINDGKQEPTEPEA